MPNGITMNSKIRNLNQNLKDNMPEIEQKERKKLE